VSGRSFVEDFLVILKKIRIPVVLQFATGLRLWRSRQVVDKPPAKELANLAYDDVKMMKVCQSSFDMKPLDVLSRRGSQIKRSQRSAVTSRCRC